MRWLLLVWLAACTPPLQSPEQIPLRIARAEHAAAWHIASCRSEPLPGPVDDAALASVPEVHDARSRCLVVAAEAYAVCVTCCSCLDDDGACQATYEADQLGCE